MELYTRGYTAPLPRRWNYYRSPDGVDLTEKLLATNYFATSIACVGCVLDYMVYTKPKTVHHALGRFAVITAPLVGTASLFTATTFLSTNLRGKDDIFNYFIGGFSCGSIWGAVMKNGWRGTLFGFILGMAGVIKKYCVTEGIILFPMPKNIEMGHISYYRNDWSLTPEYPKDWTSNPEEV